MWKAIKDQLNKDLAENLERKAEIERAKAGKTFRRSGKHVRAAARLERQAAKVAERRDAS